MSSVRYALEKLDMAISALDETASYAEVSLLRKFGQEAGAEGAGNVIDVDFLAMRLDRAIDTVEALLHEEG
jgi:hypothetical protein